MVPDPNGGNKKVPDYWKKSVTMMQDTKFLKNLVDYDKEGITEDLVNKIQSEITKPNF
jgi:hypothetical protein